MLHLRLVITTKQDMLNLIEVILKEPKFGTRKMRELSPYLGIKFLSSEIDIIETKDGDEWDSWDNYNIKEFSHDHDPKRVAQFVTDINGYTNYSPTRKAYEGRSNHFDLEITKRYTLRVV